MEENKKHPFFDLRRLIGALFVLYGAILIIYGLVAHPSTQIVTWNIDLWWGVVSLIFGLLFLLASLRAQKLEDD